MQRTKENASNRPARRGRSPRRRGVIYVMVLGTALCVGVIALSGLMAVRIERRVAGQTADFGQARHHARTAIEMGFNWIGTDPNWRTNRPNGIWVADASVGTGTYTLTVVDPDDNDLSLAPNSRIVLTGTGAEGDTTFTLSVTVTPKDGGFEISPGTWTQVVN